VDPEFVVRESTAPVRKETAAAIRTA
jgi:hypothetical protein